MKQAMFVCVSVTIEVVTDNNSQPLSDISNRQPTMTYELSSSYDYFYGTQPETITHPYMRGVYQKTRGNLYSSKTLSLRYGLC